MQQLAIALSQHDCLDFLVEQRHHVVPAYQVNGCQCFLIIWPTLDIVAAQAISNHSTCWLPFFLAEACRPLDGFTACLASETSLPCTTWTTNEVSAARTLLISVWSGCGIHEVCSGRRIRETSIWAFQPAFKHHSNSILSYTLNEMLRIFCMLPVSN